MHLLFVDESGTAPNKPGRQKYFVLGGIVIPEGTWHKVSSELSDLKSQYRVYREVKWRYFSPHNKDKSNSLVHLAAEERVSLRDRIFGIIASRRALKVISVVTSVEAAFELSVINTSDELYQFTYKPITERFQYYLQDIERDSGVSTYGMIVCDHRGPRDDKRLQELHQRLVERDGIYSSRYDNLVEGLFIAPSHLSVGIQLADLVAGAIYRKFESGDDRCYSQIENSIRADGGGVINGYGLVKTPTRGWK